SCAIQSSQLADPDRYISTSHSRPTIISPSITDTYRVLDGPPETFTGVRLSVPDGPASFFFFLRTFDLGMCPHLSCDVRGTEFTWIAPPGRPRRGGPQSRPASRSGRRIRGAGPQGRAPHAPRGHSVGLRHSVGFQHRVGFRRGDQARLVPHGTEAGAHVA